MGLAGKQGHAVCHDTLTITANPEVMNIASTLDTLELIQQQGAEGQVWSITVENCAVFDAHSVLSRSLPSLCRPSTYVSFFSSQYLPKCDYDLAWLHNQERNISWMFLRT